MTKIGKIIAFAFVATLTLAGCGRDNGSMLVNKWVEINHTMSMNVKSDSTFIVKQYPKVILEGKWHLSEDEKTFILSTPVFGDKELLIKELTDDSLVLVDNGNPMIFTPKKGL
jgi:hypothetical protein